MEQMNVISIIPAPFSKIRSFTCTNLFALCGEPSKKMASGKALTLGGDGKADTPGHSAKYGSYGLLDLDLMLVVHIELVQVSAFNFPV